MWFGSLLLGAALGAVVTLAVVDLPSAASSTAGVAVTDGWAHSPITRLGIGAQTTAGVAVTDGWAHSPITRLGIGAQTTAGVAVTDGWAHSPITRQGADSGTGIARLRALAARYQAQDFAAEARSR